MACRRSSVRARYAPPDLTEKAKRIRASPFLLNLPRRSSGAAQARHPTERSRATTPGSLLFQAGVRAPAPRFRPQRFRHWSCCDRDRGGFASAFAKATVDVSAVGQQSARHVLPLRLAVWYSSAGMDGSLSVFTDALFASVVF